MLRASLLSLSLALCTLGCGGSKKGGTLMVDIPVLPYKAPDIEELSGVSDDEPEPEPEPEPQPAPTEAPPPAPAPAAATPAPAPAPAKPATPPAKPPAKPPAAPATPKKP